LANFSYSAIFTGVGPFHRYACKGRVNDYGNYFGNTDEKHSKMTFLPAPLTTAYCSSTGPIGLLITKLDYYLIDDSGLSHRVSDPNYSVQDPMEESIDFTQQ